ncbi:hypothetical protein QJS10_CPB04g02022 [Acorus calamus]|uniref:Transposase MuDR plant domain-containing protein n=1 Tax=Acorus calamus TaxID=4465 RepID=A0AAV9F1U2_ACOCL|nr:hypothetical protein QJS10_CPB04g02022 [Acorus calamus]
METTVQSVASVQNYVDNMSPFQPPTEHNPHLTQIENTVLSHDVVDSEHEELQFDVEYLDIEDVFICDDEEQSNTNNSVEDEENEGDPECVGDEVVEVEGMKIDDSGSDSDEVCSDEFESEFVEIDDEIPNMKVGSKFSNVNQFRDALRQHCVINEFVVLYEKNERCRVTARCKSKECTWRIHASVLSDGVTFQVKTLKNEHTCTSVNKVGNEMATSQWLAHKMTPILQKTPEVGPSKLKAGIEEKYNITLPYSRVLHARGRH